ncbi:hypothetical protein UMM65_00145 [Aureibaculum sp. 2210JD6-5]|uniref:hypothetical protein n=1 Tax=Aureibaculum sp. 2210JD6-5 TaxID=3103957 RepID=UPI002AACAB1C|nr:hypothetical protein [Aureibaculum sp. 2210JD6-5]MDY7393639.1 hypothetical protein [Aureibaculum sp. 2210JD6-5]
MIHSQHNFDKNQDSEPFGPQFWDKVVKTLFITGLSLILIMIALKWSGIIA